MENKMTLAIAVIMAIAGLGLILFGLGYSVIFYAAGIPFNRSMTSEVADQGKAYVESALGRIKSEFVRKQLIGRLGTMAGSAAVSFLRGELTSSIRRGFLFAGCGLLCIIGSFNVPWLLVWLWP